MTTTASPYPIRRHQISHPYAEDHTETRDRESFVYITKEGGIEGWRTKSAFGNVGSYYGGIEVHSKAPLRDGQEPSHGYCEWTRGTCYHDGSSLAFDQIQHLFENPASMFAHLASWSRSRFGGEQL